MTPRLWLIVTPEYPPSAGGVSDYTRTLARALAERGDTVQVWAPLPASGDFVSDIGVECRSLPDHFGAATRRELRAALDRLDRNAVVLIQYVPHGFGMRGMNLAFAHFLGGIRRRLWLMVHEALYPYVPGQPLTHRALATVTRAMLAAATRHAERVFVSTPAWEPFLERYGQQPNGVEWLPIPATIPSPANAGDAARVRQALDIAAGQPLLGHFGTYGRLIAEPLAETVRLLQASHPALSFLMLGRNASTFVRDLGSSAARGAIHAREDLAPSDVANHLSALDVALFPFPDGISTRRTSAMAALSVGSALVTTHGASTEGLWARSNAVVLVPPNPPHLARAAFELVTDAARKQDLKRRSRTLYQERFEVARVVEKLLRYA